MYGKMMRFEIMNSVCTLPKKYAMSGAAVRFAETDTETASDTPASARRRGLSRTVMYLSVTWSYTFTLPRASAESRS